MSSSFGATAMSGTPMTERIFRLPPRRWLAMLALGYLLQVALRLWLGWQQTAPSANPDETGYLFAARVLTGGASADLSGWALYQIGYPLLLTPAFVISDDPITIYRLVIATNALLSALIMPLAYLAGRRLELDRGPSFVVASLAGLLPASIFFTQFALTDAILPVVVLAWILAVHTWVTTGRFGWAVGALAAYAAATHTRGQVIVFVSLVLIGYVYDRGLVPRRTAIVAALTLIVGFVVGVAANRWLAGQNYPAGALQLGELVRARLTTPSGWARTLSGAAGQLWYLVVATWGLAGAGLVVAVVAIRRAADPLRIVAGVTLLTTLGIAVLASAALPDEQRVGNFAYGRYVASVAPVLFVAGAAALLRLDMSRGTRLVAIVGVAMLIAAGVVVLYAGERLTTHTFVQFDFPETSFLTRDWYRLRIWHASVAALVLLLVVFLFGRRAPILAAAVIAVVAVAANIAATEKISRPMTAQRALIEIPGLKPDDKVVMDRSLSWRVAVQQAFQIRSEVTHVVLAATPVPDDATLVIVGVQGNASGEQSWPGGPPDGWRQVIARQTYLGNWAAFRKT